MHLAYAKKVVEFYFLKNHLKIWRLKDYVNRLIFSGRLILQNSSLVKKISRVYVCSTKLFLIENIAASAEFLSDRA